METSAQNQAMFSVVEDKHLRKYVIETAMALEKAVQEGRLAMEQSLTKAMDWGLSIEASMNRPREDKPIVFTFKYRVERAKFVEWLSKHQELMGGEVLGFTNGGITVMIPGPGTDKYAKTSFIVTISYQEENDDDISFDMLNKTVEFTVHREVISEHDWMVKTNLE